MKKLNPQSPKLHFTPLFTRDVLLRILTCVTVEVCKISKVCCSSWLRRSSSKDIWAKVTEEVKWFLFLWLLSLRSHYDRGLQTTFQLANTEEPMCYQTDFSAMLEGQTKQSSITRPQFLEFRMLCTAQHLLLWDEEDTISVTMMAFQGTLQQISMD